jgi:outer membrane receptor protein involved in Fe transport
MSISHLPSFLFLSACAATALYSQNQNPITSGYLELLPIDALVTTLSLEELTQVVITDTKRAQSRDKVTQKLEIIDQTQFEQLGENNRNLAELMQYTSGQFVNVLSRNDANWGSYAGLGPKYNTYMLDGLPIDSFTDAMSLDPWAFERVEVQKGPAAILYSNYLTMDFAGNESPLAGTTNFILKDRIEGPLTRSVIGAGSYNTQNARLYHQNRHGNLSYFIGGNIERSDYTQYGGDNTWLQTTEDPDYKKSKIYGKISYKPSKDDTLSLFIHRTQHTGDIGRRV